MKNITVTVPDEVYRAARIRAAEQGTSVSALVAEFLADLAQKKQAEFDRLAALEREIVAGIAHFRASDRLNRDSIYDRALR